MLEHGRRLRVEGFQPLAKSLDVVVFTFGERLAGDVVLTLDFGRVVGEVVDSARGEVRPPFCNPNKGTLCQFKCRDSQGETSK